MSTIAFARGVPAADLLPIDDIVAATNSVLAEDPVTLLSYGTGGGYAPLREHLAEQHGVKPSQIVITTGSLQGFWLLLQVMKNVRDNGNSHTAIVENPTYDRPLIALDREGWKVQHVRCDADGMDIDELERALDHSPATLIYTIPTFQNPGGSTMVAERRTRLLELAAKHNCIVLEDDPYGDLWFDTPPPTRLFDMPSDATVVLSRSFSKLVSPGLRVGYLVLPEGLCSAVERFANDTYISPVLLGNAIVHRMLENGTANTAIERARLGLADRCKRMTAALDAHFPDAVYAVPTGGYFMWVRLTGVNTNHLSEATATQGVTFVPGSAFGPDNHDGARLAFSSPAIDDIAIGIERIAGALTVA
jgi:DNA-binding transcriptional MocR family regulator